MKSNAPNRSAPPAEWHRPADDDPLSGNLSPGRVLPHGALYLLLVLSLVPWRSQAIYEGGIDPTVLGKAAVAVIALSGAFVLATRTRRRAPVGLGPAFVVGLTLLISTLGALVAGHALVTLVVVARLAITTATVLLLLTTAPWMVGVAGVLSAMATVSVIAAATGLPTLASSGRLGGGVPEIHPNELANLAGAPLVALTVLMVRQGVRAWSASAFFVLLAIALATGSRTGLIAIALAITAALLVNGIRHRSTVYALLFCLPFAYAVGYFADIFGRIATRAGSTDTTSSLDARFEGWSAVLAWGWTDWKKWIGIGLSEKTIPVDHPWRDEQVLDSSWVSLLAQTGLLGTIVVAGLVAWCCLTALVSRHRRHIAVPLMTLLLVRSLTESGLLDSATPFLLLILLATVLTARNRRASSARRPGSHRLVIESQRKA